MPFAEVLWYQLETVQRYEALLEEAALEADVPFHTLLRSFLDEPHWPQWICSDGIHLNSDGHAHVAARLQRWQPLLHWAGLELAERPTPMH
jgi:hypothetical protein